MRSGLICRLCGCCNRSLEAGAGLERPGAVALFRVVLPDDVLVLVVDVYLLVVVGVLPCRRWERKNRPHGWDVPLAPWVEGELECPERSDALHVLGVEPSGK